MTNTTAKIADRVRGIAAEQRCTQQDIADALRISRTSVVERYNGRIAFTAPEIFALSVKMRVPVSRFFPDAAEVGAPELETAVAS